MNIAAVRAMTQNRERARLEALSAVDAQRMTVRCDLCGWYKRELFVGDGKRAFQAHLQSVKHSYAVARSEVPNKRKRGPQAKTRDRHEGRSWAR